MSAASAPPSGIGRLLGAALTAVLSARTYLRPARVPMPFGRDPGRPDTQRLVLLLPGRGDRGGDFKRRGFIRMAREAGLSADIAAADAHLGYYRKGYVTGAEHPPLFLAYGESDRYARGHRLRARSLSAERVLTEPGGHDWGTWRRRWARALRRQDGVPGLREE